MTLYPVRPYLSQILSKCLSVGTLSTLGLLLGFIPSLSERSIEAAFSSSVLAQPQSVETTYAAALLDIESARQDAYNRIKQKTGGNVPEIKCYEPNSLNSLSGEIRDIAREYCKSSEAIITRHRISLADFNRITSAISGNPPANPALKQKIQSELMRLQR